MTTALSSVWAGHPWPDNGIHISMLFPQAEHDGFKSLTSTESCPLATHYNETLIHSGEECERETKREAHTETERQGERETGRQTGRELKRERQTDSERERGRELKTERPKDRKKSTHNKKLSDCSAAVLPSSLSLRFLSIFSGQLSEELPLSCLCVISVSLCFFMFCQQLRRSQTCVSQTTEVVGGYSPLLPECLMNEVALRCCT